VPSKQQHTRRHQETKVGATPEVIARSNPERRQRKTLRGRSLPPVKSLDQKKRDRESKVVHMPTGACTVPVDAQLALVA
jgi:hypothetical protein